MYWIKNIIMNCEVLLHGVHVDINTQKKEDSFLLKGEFFIFWLQTFTWVESNPEMRFTNSHISSDCCYLFY